MANLSIVTATGFTREEAAASANLKTDPKFDATPAFKKAGMPTGKYLEAFCEEYSQKKHKGLPGAGYFITVEAGVADTRERPYKVETIVTEGTRKYQTFYEGLVDVIKDKDGKIIGGTVVPELTKESKSDAEDAAKEYVTATKKDVHVRLVKTPIEGQPVALVVSYTPSINTKVGTYIFFSVEA